MAERAPGKKLEIGKPAEKSDSFAQFIDDWRSFEDNSISQSDKALKKTDNAFFRAVLEFMRDDSLKHKALLQMLSDSVKKERIMLSVDELSELMDIVNRHMEAEARTIETAKDVLDKSELFSTRFILNMLIADETKNYELFGKLDDLKKNTVLVT